MVGAVNDGKKSFLLKSENVNAWVSVIERILAEDEFFLGDFVKNSTKFTEENFSWDGISWCYLEEMRSSIERTSEKSFLGKNRIF